MATYAVYHTFYMQMPYQPTPTNRYVTWLFVVDVPAGRTDDDVKTALIRGGYELDFTLTGRGRPALDLDWTGRGRPALDLAWTELVVSRLKNAPDEVIGAWKKGLLPKIAWEDLEVDLDAADPD